MRCCLSVCAVLDFSDSGYTFTQPRDEHHFDHPTAYLNYNSITLRLLCTLWEKIKGECNNVTHSSPSLSDSLIAIPPLPFSTLQYTATAATASFMTLIVHFSDRFTTYIQGPPKSRRNVIVSELSRRVFARLGARFTQPISLIF